MPPTDIHTAPYPQTEEIDRSVGNEKRSSRSSFQNAAGSLKLVFSSYYWSAT
ncbi:hypothetical protein EXN66_Car000962 [Channa argus]|uniref:Uncharacterized protein n=1 Tax=Channa argus TaxID=215402 RepID=A0A6G1QZP7_CHAAH|nr:hypothetical protein EXN66_Car000962 [Channa argus]